MLTPMPAPLGVAQLSHLMKIMSVTNFRTHQKALEAPRGEN